MRIAFFDSGLGGISVLHEAMKQLPQEDFLYFADTLHVPYGTKPKDEVLGFVKKAVETISKEEVSALVIACNTATSIAISELRGMYEMPIIGMEPAVKPALAMNRSSGKRVLVFATPLTLKQSKYRDLVSRIDDMGMVDSLPMPELVEFCEQLNVNSRQVIDYFHSMLEPFDLSLYGTVVLGCTHYPFFRSALREVLPAHIQIVDGSAGTVNRLTQLLSDRDLLSGKGRSDLKWLCSNNDPVYLAKMAKALELFGVVGV
ncbi:glutamate racemase [Paenibacillus planticolens]|uniref:Glutamate racemase n=1 Tax=Paenibacillus planticolens TaxID=2654976 RepID=A0ABX1ZZS4_9BACL|nr:glutamate racemase [Paenibacillus planticolens]NOV04580.1 glutamate racemase [Paenibacillus planticolens]